MCTAGAATLTWDGGSEEIAAGDTILIPAAMGAYSFTPKSEGTSLMETYIRKMEEDKDEYLEK